MGVIGSREFRYIMKLDDQTRREREALNRGLGEIQASAAKSAKAVEGGLIGAAKGMKQSMEGIKAVMELGGLVQLVGAASQAIGKFVTEAAKVSPEFKAMQDAAASAGQELTAGLAEAFEPIAVAVTGLIQGFRGFMDILSKMPGPLKVVLQIIGSAMLAAIVALIARQVVLTTVTWGLTGAKLAEAAASAALNPLLWVGVAAAVATIGVVVGLTTAYARKTEAVAASSAAIKDGSALMNRASEAAKAYSDTLKGLGDEELKTARASLFSAMSLSTSMDALTVANAKLRELDAEISRRKEASAKAAADIAAKAAADFSDIMADYKMKLLQQAGDRLGVLDMERQQAIAKLQERLKDKERLEQAMVLLEKYYGNERLKILEEMGKKDVQGARGSSHDVNAGVVKAARDLSSSHGGGHGGGGMLSGSHALGGSAPAATNAVGGGPFDAILKAIGPVIQSFGGMIAQLASVQAIMNPLQTIIGAIMEVLGPVIDNLLGPLVGILKIVGYVIGKMLVPVLELLRPVIELIAALFVWLYNTIIMPIANGFIRIFNMIGNFFAGWINRLLDSINWLWHTDWRAATRDVNSGTLSAIDVGTVANAGSSGSSGGSSGGGTGASYAAGTTIKIDKIEIRADFIAGDAGLMDVAVMLRDKLVEAERLGR